MITFNKLIIPLSIFENKQKIYGFNETRFFAKYINEELNTNLIIYDHVRIGLYKNILMQ